MGMTIEKAIKQLETYSIPCGRYKEAYDFSIDTMRKYQRIEQIIKDWEDGRFSDAVGCLRVKVALDGNDD